MHKYLPHTEEDIKEMLKVIEVSNLDDLFCNIPKELILHRDYHIPNQMDDIELSKHLESLSNLNQRLKIFRGYGAYHVYTPSVVKSLTNRQEFLTSYTPYQPEVSQGTLQYIFEYQSLILEITGMDVTNASMYDGPTATAEAMLMALSHTQKRKIIYSKTLHPKLIDVIKTYGHFRNVEFVELPEKDGVTDFSDLNSVLENSAAIILSNPNKYGIIEDYNDISKYTQKHKSLFILNHEIRSLALLKTPNELGADIACGDLQTLGMPLASGGAYAGYLASKNYLLRKLPGRICGVTTDESGKRSFVLTLQAREQHIRRAKANSNICSNQSLMALSAAIYLSWLGKNGFIELAKTLLNGAYTLKEKLIQTGYFEEVYHKPHFNEFVLKSKIHPKEFEEDLLELGYLGPQYLGNQKFLFAYTEMLSPNDINDFVKKVGEIHAKHLR